MPRGRMSIRFAYRDPGGKPDRPDKPGKPDKGARLAADTGLYASTGSMIGGPPVTGLDYQLDAAAGFYFTNVAGSVSEEN